MASVSNCVRRASYAHAQEQFHLHVHLALRLQGIQGMIALAPAGARLMASATRTGPPMTGHRAASPVTTEVSDFADDDLFTASRPESMRHASTLLATPQFDGGTGYALDQPTATCALSPRPESVKAGREFTRATLRE